MLIGVSFQSFLSHMKQKQTMSMWLEEIALLWNVRSLVLSQTLYPLSTGLILMETFFSPILTMVKKLVPHSFDLIISYLIPNGLTYNTQSKYSLSLLFIKKWPFWDICFLLIFSYIISSEFNQFSVYTVVDQFYQTRVNDEFVLLGNSATLKCILPSFVGDFVQVVDWETDTGETYSSVLETTGKLKDGYLFQSTQFGN